MVANQLKNSKWEVDREGPFQIVRQNKGGAYILRDALGEEMEKKYTVEMLSPIDEQLTAKNAMGHPLTEGPSCEVQTVLDHKETSDGYKYLVKWKGFDISENSWVKGSDFDSLKPINKYWKWLKKNEQAATTVKPREGDNKQANNKTTQKVSATSKDSTSGLGGSHVRSGRKIQKPDRYRH
jgi:hypothetical protein